MTLLSRVRVLAAKIETTPGTIETLAAADAVFNVFNPVIQPTIAFQQRQGQGAFSSLPGVPGARGGTVTFATEIMGTGGGAIPAWASTFLPACGWVAAAQVYSPSSAAPGASVKTLSIGVYEQGVRKTLRGAVGDFEIVLAAGQIGVVNWTFTGIWDDPTDVAILAPTYPTIAPFRYAAATSTIAAFAFKHAQLMIKAGNEVMLREDAGNVSGYISGLITNRMVTGTIDPEASLVATKDPYTEWTARDEGALSVILAGGGDTITLAAPKLQFTNLQEGERSGNQTDQIDFQCNRSAAAGNDEFTITFAV